MTNATKPGGANRILPETFRSPWWLPGGHLQTIYPLMRRGAAPNYRRERIRTPDEDFIDLDWLPATTIDAPLVVLFHGLEGSSRSHYARALMRAVQARGWRGVVAHFRGCSGEPNEKTRAYHSGDSDEVDWVLRHLADAAKPAPLFATGVSLGGNALLKWLGERDSPYRSPIVGAVAICPPLDLTICGHALDSGINRLYTRRFLDTLKPKALEKLARQPDLFDADRMHAARTLFEFDDIFTGPVHGFTGAADYWRRASSKPWLAAISTPTLLICAANDPFVPSAAWPSTSELGPGVTFECTASGGHVGFLQPPWPGHLEWLPSRALQHFEHLCQ